MSLTCQEAPSKSQVCSKSRKQFTLKCAAERTGRGLFTGQEVVLKICPAPADTGIVFERTDLPDLPDLPARLEFVKQTPRCTILAHNYFAVQTVEHLLSVLYGLQIDNARILVSGSELPIFDGSGNTFVEMIGEAGVEEQEKKKTLYTLEHPVSWSHGDTHLVALPSDEYRISYTLHFPDSDCLRSQYYTFSCTPENFLNEIVSCRTFAIYEEIAPYVEKGIIKGGGLENSVIVKDEKVVNPEGLRFPEEMARHKVLDIIGDLSLISGDIKAHVIAIRSGHTSNIAFAKKLKHFLKKDV